MLKLYWCFWLDPESGMMDGEEIEARSKAEALKLYPIKADKVVAQLIDEIEVYQNRIQEYNNKAHRANELIFSDPQDRDHWITERNEARDRASELMAGRIYFERRKRKHEATQDRG